MHTSIALMRSLTQFTATVHAALQSMTRPNLVSLEADPTLPEVLKAANACFDRWRRPNDVVRRLCCITKGGV
jgi:hypothetical protein